MAANRLRAIVERRCPVCLTGQTFRSLWELHSDCPVCGIPYERESGYFLTAMFFAYLLGFLLLAPVALLLYLRQTETVWFVATMAALALAAWPLIFRYSRILWMHADQLMDPRPDPRAAGDGAAIPPTE